MGVTSGWGCWRALGRRKVVDTLSLGKSELARVLSTFDLTALGVGSTLGVGVYVLAGNVSKTTAGPAVVLSFLIAAIASVFAGLCYAEFGARVPRAGSAYTYSYVCIGEFIAFIIGWNLILEYVIVALALGVKKSTLVNNVFTVINIAVVVFVIIAGSIKADTKYWRIPEKEVPNDAGTGGFLPFGIKGAIAGAATCFYGFVGFDCVATTGEEVKNPQRAIPIAIIGSLIIIFLSYFGVSTVLTLMLPYYMQDSDAPIPQAFSAVDFPVGKWIVTIGGIFGLCASLFGAMFPLPRIIYAMSMDGLMFKFLGQVNQRFKTPLYGTLIAGLLTGLMAAMFNLNQLVDMMSIGTLLAYTIVAACVLLLRYRAESPEENEGYKLVPSDLNDSEGEEIVYKHVDPYDGDEDVNPEYVESTNLMTLKVRASFTTVVKQIFRPSRHPTSLSSNIVMAEVLIFGVLSMFLGLCTIYWQDGLESLDPFALTVPLVPLIPALSILVNVYLMLMLDKDTWIRFGVWMAIGLLIYFLYGVRRSTAPHSHKKELHCVKGDSNAAFTEDDQIPELQNQKGASESTSNMRDRLSKNILTQKDNILKEQKPFKINDDDDDIKKSLAYIEDLERVLDYNDNLKYTDNTILGSVNDKDSDPNLEKVAASCDVSASAPSTPVIHSFSPENIPVSNTNPVKKFSTASLYPNVIVVSYGSDNESVDIKYPMHVSENIGNIEDAKIEVGTSDTIKGKSVSEDETDVASPVPKSDSKFDYSDLGSNKAPPVPPPMPPTNISLPTPPPFPAFTQPFTAQSLPPTNISLPTPPPLPPFTQPFSPLSLTIRKKSPPSSPSQSINNSPSHISSETNSLDETLSLGESGYGTNGKSKPSNGKYKSEPGTPVIPDTKFLLRMGSLKNSDFARKLESLLQDKLYIVKPIDNNPSKKAPLFTKHNTHSHIDFNSGKLTNKAVSASDSNNHEQSKKTTEMANRTVEESKTQEKSRDDEIADIKWKLEKFLASRTERPVLRRPSSQPNLTSLVDRDDIKHHKTFEHEHEFESKGVGPLSRIEKKIIDNGKDFEMVKKQRLLMGEVLASIKFVSNKSSIESRHDSDLESISDNSDANEEVFEDSANHSGILVHL
ncbi:hypothetical protein C0J52_06403 [Blattella germanica]|nr:hypothetical protein C0J52_06403 [Blattella germanica]